MIARVCARLYRYPIGQKEVMPLSHANEVADNSIISLLLNLDVTFNEFVKFFVMMC